MFSQLVPSREGGNAASRVDDWRGGRRLRGCTVSDCFRLCRCLNSRRSSVSSRRSSNRTCGITASGFPTGFIVRHTVEAFGARDEDEARPVLRTHTRAKTVSCPVLAPYVVCRGSCAPDRRRDRQRLDTLRRGSHRRSTPTSRPRDGSTEFALPAKHPYCLASALR
jgi:hypothetical protein